MNELSTDKLTDRLGTIQEAETPEARDQAWDEVINAYETRVSERESLRLELKAEQHTHLKDNETLIRERDSLREELRLKKEELASLSQAVQINKAKVEAEDPITKIRELSKAIDEYFRSEKRLHLAEAEPGFGINYEALRAHKVARLKVEELLKESNRLLKQFKSESITVDKPSPEDTSLGLEL